MRNLRYIFCAFFVLGGLVLQAAPVSQSRALDVARKVFAAQPATKAAGDVKLIWDGEDIATKSNDQPAFYVFGREGGGFVIIAGDDNVRPVLAFSEDSPFAVEGMPDNVKWWMEQIKNYVRTAGTQSPEAARQWANLVTTKTKLNEGMLQDVDEKSATVCWNQHEPGNLMAPTVDGQSGRSVSGCLPLALAEILTWFGWPNQGEGYTPAYSYTPENGGTQNMPSADMASFTMTDAEWAALQALDTYAKFRDCEDPVRANVAELVFDCGLLVHAKYNDSANGGTGATSSNVIVPFSNHMKYSKGAYLDYFVDHTPREWNAMLKAQVLKHPVLYSGRAHEQGIDAGHAYVLDGYATLEDDDVFHFNFGWGGKCNGYYYASYQNTKGSDGSYNFNYALEALFDFIPDKTGKSKPVRMLELLDGTYEIKGSPYTFIGISTNAPVKKGDVFLDFAYFNDSSVTYDGIVKVVLEDKDGKVKEDNLFVVTFETANGFGPGYYDYYRTVDGSHVTLTKDLVFGDRLAIYYTDDDARKNFVKMGGSVDGSMVLELPVMPAAFIKTDSSYKVNDFFQFQLMNHDYPYLGTVWTVTSLSDGVSATFEQSEREFRFYQPGTYKIEAAVAPDTGEAVVETLVTYIEVK